MAKEGLSVEKALKGAKKKRETWSQTKRTNEITERIDVTKLDNEGCLVTTSKDWRDSKDVWHDKEIKLHSLTNPLDPDESNSPVDTLFETIARSKK